MAIIDTEATPEDPLLFNKVFMKTLHVSQDNLANVNDSSIYSVKIVYGKFAEKATGDIVYAQTNKTILIDDYLKEAMKKAQTGDMDLINAIKAIEVAVAKIIADKDNLMLEVVT